MIMRHKNHSIVTSLTSAQRYVTDALTSLAHRWRHMFPPVTHRSFLCRVCRNVSLMYFQVPQRQDGTSEGAGVYVTFTVLLLVQSSGCAWQECWGAERYERKRLIEDWKRDLCCGFVVICIVFVVFVFKCFSGFYFLFFISFDLFHLFLSFFHLFFLYSFLASILSFINLSFPFSLQF